MRMRRFWLMSGLLLLCSAAATAQTAAEPRVLWKDELRLDSAGRKGWRIGAGELSFDGQKLTILPVDKPARRQACIMHYLPYDLSGTNAANYLQFTVPPDGALSRILITDSACKQSVMPWLKLRHGTYTMSWFARLPVEKRQTLSRGQTSMVLYSQNSLTMEGMTLATRPRNGIFFSVTGADGAAKPQGAAIAADDTVTIEMNLGATADAMELSLYIVNASEKDWRFTGDWQTLSIASLPPSLHDDGVNGDATAKDGVYSCRFKIGSVPEAITCGANSAIAAVHYQGADLREGGMYFGLCPYSIQIAADPDAAKNSAAGNMTLYDFGPPGSQTQIGSVAIDEKTEPAGFKWLRKPKSYGAVPPVHRDLDALSNDFAEIAKGTTASFRVAVKPGKYRAVVGIGGCFVTCYTNRYLPLDATVAVNGKEVYTTPLEGQDWLKKERFRFIDHDVRPGEDFYDIYRAPYLKDIAVDVDAPSGTIEVEVKAGVNPVPLNYVAIYPAGDEATAARFDRLIAQRKENFKLFWQTLEPTREMLANPLTVDEATWREECPNKSLGLFVRGNPGELVYRNSLPLRDEISGGVEILAAPGQIQDASIGLHAFEALKGVHVRMLNVPAALAGAAQLQYVIQYAYARSHLRSVYIGPNYFCPVGTRDFAAGESSSYWLTVKVPTDFPPGRYAWRLEFAAENAAPVSVPVRLTVHPLRLPSLDDHAIALIAANSKAEFEFCREIGCTTAVMGFGWPKQSSFVTNETGKVVDFNTIGGRSRESMERWCSLYKESGLPGKYPYARLQAVGNDRLMFPFGTFAPLTPQYFDAARFSYSRIRDIAVKFGGCEGIIADTGGEMGTDSQKPNQAIVDAAVELYKHLDGLEGVKLSNNCNDPVTTETFFPYLQAMGVRCTKAWAMSDELSQYGKKKELYSYSVDGRFQNGLLSWAHGAQGNCKEWLAFPETIPFNDFLCGGETCGGTAHSVAVEGPDGLIPTIRSEAWRDSVIDRQYIRLLEQAVAKSSGGAVKENAERFLNLIRCEALNAPYAPGQGKVWWNGNEPWNRIRLDMVRLVAVELAAQLAGTPLAAGDIPSFKGPGAEKTKPYDFTADAAVAPEPIPEEAARQFDSSAWVPIKAGESWENQGFAYDGAAWYRTEFKVPAAWEKPVIHFGAVDETAWVYVDGKYVGTHDGWNSAFTMVIESLAPGETHSLAVRVLDREAMGGMWKPVTLFRSKADCEANDAKQALNLENWEFALRPGDRDLSQFILADGLFYPVGARSVVGQLTLVPADEKDSRKVATCTAKARLFSSDGKLLREVDLGKVSLYKPSSFVMSLEGLAAGTYDVEVTIDGTKFAALTVYIIPPLK